MGKNEHIKFVKINGSRSIQHSKLSKSGGVQLFKIKTESVTAQNSNFYLQKIL